MNLKKKKKLIARILNIGKKRISLDNSRANEIKEAITRQDIRELIAEGIVKIKEKKGRRKKQRKKTKKKEGKIKKKIKQRKREYVVLTRKLRKCLLDLKNKQKISKEDYYSLRKKIKTRAFKSLSHLREELR